VLSRVRVVKVGGGEMEDPGFLPALGRALAQAGPVVVVHGGGRIITRWQERLGLPVSRRDGLRITTPELAELVEMVLCGPVRNALVRSLREQGLRAVGVAGAEGCLRAELVEAEHLGRVGRVVWVDRELIGGLVDAGLTPVIAPVSLGPDGAAVNVNADDAAVAVAQALDAAELLFVSDVPGVLEAGRTLPSVRVADLDRLIAEGVVQGGMRVKLTAAARARGRLVRVGDVSVLTDPAAGTALCWDEAA